LTAKSPAERAGADIARLLHDLSCELHSESEQAEIGRAAREHSAFMADKLNEQIATEWHGITDAEGMANWLLNTAREALKRAMS